MACGQLNLGESKQIEKMKGVGLRVESICKAHKFDANKIDAVLILSFVMQDDHGLKMDFLSLAVVKALTAQLVELMR